MEPLPKLEARGVRLTGYSHGCGCGCKIAPGILDDIPRSSLDVALAPRMLVASVSQGDATAYDLGNGTSVASTTEFLMHREDFRWPRGLRVRTCSWPWRANSAWSSHGSGSWDPGGKTR